MKTKIKAVSLEKERRHGVALLASVCLTLLIFTTSAGQAKDSKHITAIQLGGAAEGSRVTVVSDSPLADYEAFRRRDRFYVKIPLADLSAAAPRFRGDGFEDVQVQKVGDSQIVSFKLQPGATARVDQRGNRLDVVFSAANKNPLPDSGNPYGDRGPDAAGPVRFASSSFRERSVTGRNGSLNEGRSGDRRWQPFPKANSNKSVANQLTNANVATTSASPSSSPSSILSPGTATNYQPLSATTPISESSSSSANSYGFATLLGALVLLSLIACLILVRRHRETAGQTFQAKKRNLQPMYSSAGEVSELSDAGTDSRTPP